MNFKGSKKMLLALLATLFVFCAAGCSFDTYVKTSEKAEDAIAGFFRCISSGDMKKCSDYLADNASFDINNQTGYEFTEKIMQYRLSRLSWSVIEPAEYDGVNAHCIIGVTGPDINSVREQMPEAYALKERTYLTENSLNQIPEDESGHDIVDMLAWQAFEGLADDLKDEAAWVTVNLVYESGSWRIVSDNELCGAVFGSNIMQEDKADENE